MPTKGNQNPFVYSLYGLTWQSNVALPGLTPSSGTGPAMTVELAPGTLDWPHQAEFDLIYERRDDANEALRLYRRTCASEFRYCYADGTTFHIDAQSGRIRGGWPGALTLDNACTYLLGPVAGLCVRLRGHSCLHASAVKTEACAVAFMGAAGAGKSTTAAALVKRGMQLLTDDITVVLPPSSGPRQFQVLTGIPRVNLWPTSTAALTGAATTLPALVPGHDYFDKQYLQVDAREPSTDIDLLGAVYCGVVTPVDRPRFRTLGRTEAALALTANAYAPYLLDARSRAQDFDLWTRLAAHIPVREVSFRADLSALDELVDAIVEDMGALPVVAA